MADSATRQPRRLADLGSGQHACFLFETDTEQRAFQADFLRAGQERGERVIFFLAGGKEEALLDALEPDGASARAAVEMGELRLLTVDSEARGEEDRLERLLRLLDEAAHTAERDGSPAIRITGEVKPLLAGQATNEGLIDFEARLERLFARRPVLSICQFDRRRVAPELLNIAIDIHPYVILGSEIFASCHYLSPEEHAGAGRAGGEFEARLGSLRRRRRLEEGLEESTARYRSLFDNACAPMLLVDQASNAIVDANEAAAAYYGYTKERLCRMRLSELAAAPEPAACRCTDRSCRLMSRHRLATGEVRDVETYGGPIRIGERLYSHVIVHDVTDLQTARGGIERFFQQSLVLICIASLEGRFLRLNPAFVELLGHSEEELLGRPFLDFVHPDDRAATLAAIADLSAARPIFSFRNRYRARLGEYRLIEWNSVADVERGLIYAMALDVTEREEMEQRLRQAQKLEAIGQLAGGVAHDFNNQLAAILGYADLLAKRLADETHRRYAENIRLGARRAADLTAQLLDFSRQAPICADAVDLHLLVGEVIEMLKHTIDKRIRLVTDLQAEPHHARGDATRLQTALLNLAVNARDALPEGGEIRFESKCVFLGDSFCRTYPDFSLRPGPFLRVSVLDTGSGIDPLVLPKIFDPFFTTKEIGSGTGMGLATVYGTIQQHGGAVTVESEPGRGSAFHLFLPFAAIGEETPKDVTPKLQKSAGRTGRILVIDDEKLVGTLVSDMLRAAGHETRVESEGEKALAWYRGHQDAIDLILFDIMMPGLSGRELFRAIRRCNPEARILLCSGYSAEGEAKKLLAEGAKGFVQKPFQQDELLTVVDAVLQK